jgi:hypothetical protein
LGVELQGVAGYCVTDEIVKGADGYNEPMQREIDRRYGRGALDKLAQAAQAGYEKKVKKEPKQEAAAPESDPAKD